MGSAIDHSFQHHHITAAGAVTAAFLVGALAGCAWQWLNRRDLVDRFVPLVMIAIGVGVLALLSKDAVDLDEPAAAMLSGLVAGNVLLEWWLRLPANRDRFEESLPRPMTGGTRVP
ncbi:MAG TPA: hypothetical protein VJ872_08220 [Nocardioides sp.]|nr:hypothetical protein [Nocardioides sp.]